MSNQLNYVNYDQDDLVAALIDLLKVTDAWKDTYESSTGQMLIEFHAAIGNLILYYVERRAEEMYISTARHKSSVLNLVKLINYTPRRRVSATGSLTFTIDIVQTKIVHIPKYTECQTVDGYKFVTNKDISIMPGSLSSVVEGVQGQLIELGFVSDGSEDQEFSVSDTYVENSNYELLVDGVAWTQVSTFISSGTTSTHYTLTQNLDDTLTITFGNNVKGLVPDAGAEITFKYIQSDGVDGNVYQTGRITTLNDTIYDEDGTEVDTTVTNSTTFTGGDDAQDIEEIRTEAPLVFSTGDRAVTRNDFKAILLDYPSIADANAWGENEETPPEYDMFNTVKLCVLLEDWVHPPDSFKTTLSTYLFTKSYLSVKYEYVTATVLDVVPAVDILAEKNYALSKAQSDVEEVLATRFVLGSTTKLGTSVKYSNIVRYIDVLDSVAYIHLILEIRQSLIATYESNYDYGDMLLAPPILRGSVKVYATTDQGSNILMAQDDELGNLTDVSSNYVVTGYVNYLTGSMGVEFEPDTFISGVYVKYQQDAEGDINVTENQICKLYETNVTQLEYVD